VSRGTVETCICIVIHRTEGGTRKGAREQALAPKEWSYTAVTGRQLGRPAWRESLLQLSEEELGLYTILLLPIVYGA